MAKVERSALVAYSSQQMFNLINDIESYPQFMPGCIAAEVLSSDEHYVEAKLTLGMKGVQQSFITRNELTPPALMVMKLVKGPFSHFEGRWAFDALEDNASKVSLNLEFDFSNPLLALSAGKWLKEIASQQVDCLCDRADKIYGTSVDSRA